MAYFSFPSPITRWNSMIGSMFGAVASVAKSMLIIFKLVPKKRTVFTLTPKKRLVFTLSD